jgi:hypothetical protein
MDPHMLLLQYMANFRAPFKKLGTELEEGEWQFQKTDYGHLKFPI